MLRENLIESWDLPVRRRRKPRSKAPSSARPTKPPRSCAVRSRPSTAMSRSGALTTSSSATARSAAQDVHRRRSQRIHRRANPQGFAAVRLPARSVRRTGTSTSSGEVIAFTARPNATTEREAEKVEAREREKAKRLVAQTEAARTSLRLDDVAGRYWHGDRAASAGADQRRAADRRS